MNCDQVFDILTRGPFPTGDAIDAGVERHIACCHQCWQMAEALRPALDLFQESLAETDQKRLPEYHGQAESAAVATLPEVVEAWISSPDWSRVRSSWQQTTSRMWRLGPSVVATVLVAASLGIFGIRTLSDTDSASIDPSAGGQSLNERPEEIPVGITLAQLSESCLKDAGQKGGTAAAPTDARAVSKSLQCCTLCHNAADQNRPRIDSLAILESCSGCHTR